ncbi:MAG: RNase adapter RapZ [Clostridia bacterium]
MYLLIVTGLSGAGKSQALRRFEDMGFFCVDNLPSEMLQGFIELCTKASPTVERAAVVVDSRDVVFKTDMERALSVLDMLHVKYELLFLDCRDDILKRRYNETRRRHPLGDDVETGIKNERNILAPLRDLANYIIDTSDLKPVDLVKRLEAIVNENAGDEFSLTFESFGYKRGVPFEADMVFDMRFSPNPYYEQDLRRLSGTDEAVKKYVMSDTVFAATLDTVEKLLNSLIPKFIEQGKRRLLVAFGCTGGRHRSVCAAQELYERMRDRYDSRIFHRDTGSEAVDIASRSGANTEGK